MDVASGVTEERRRQRALTTGSLLRSIATFVIAAVAVLTVMAELGGRTAAEALAAGIPPKQVWAAVWRTLELPASER